MSYQIVETTLRDGEQRPGLAFRPDEKVSLATALDRLGVPVIEAGVAAMGASERAVLDRLHGLGLAAELLVWNRLTDADLDLCLDHGYPAVHLSVPVSDPMLRGKLGRDRRWVLDQVDRVVGRAADRGLRVSFGAEDASRADQEFLRQVCGRAVLAGARRVRFADTLGVLNPTQTARAVRALADRVPVPIDYHGHNDLGLATANTLAAWEAGAGYLSCTLLGWGERAGNAALEEVVAALELTHGAAGPHRDQLAELAALARRTAEDRGLPVDPQKPLVGGQVFRHESGIHVDGLLKDPRTYEAWPPELVGGVRSIGVGKTSGSAGLVHLARERGIPLSPDQARLFLETMREALGRDASVRPEALWEDFLQAAGGSR